ncbi:MAG: EAL domain-containing protein, partial [Acidobacteriota bacterium]
GYESLCRIALPDGRILSGFEAFTLAERAYRTEHFDLACIRSGLLKKARLLEKGTPIFINVMPHTLLKAGELKASIKDFLERAGVSPKEVVVELVESEQVNPESLVDICDHLRDMGLRIALDDVGAGYNGLTTLATLRPDFVKLDRNLVHGIQGSRVRMVLLEALVSMAQRLGCATIAEGLEHVEDVDMCRKMGVVYGQGYYFARPDPLPVKPRPLPTGKPVRHTHSRGMIRLADFTDSTPTLSIEAGTEEAVSLFRDHPTLTSLVVLDGNHPIGYVSRGDLTYSRSLNLVSSCRPVTRLLKDRVSKSSLAVRLLRENECPQPWIVVNENDDYAGTIDPGIILSQILSGFDHEELHPLSLLPTGPVLRSTLDLHLQNDADPLLVYIDIDRFKAYNDRYGFIRGDAMIKLLAEIIRQERPSWPDAYMGHIGGDDYIIMLPHDTPNLIERLSAVVESFRHLSAHLYDNKDIHNGYYVTEEGDHLPVAALSVVVVNGSQGPLCDSLKAGERAARLKKLAKVHSGSIIVVEGDPPALLAAGGDPPCQDDLKGYLVDVLTRIAASKRDENHHDLDPLFKIYPFIELVYELDDSGVQRFPNWINPQMRGRIKGGGVGVDRSDKPYFKSVKESRSPFISDIYLSTASEDFCVTVSIPLFDGAGQPGSVLVADISLPGLVELFRTPAQPRAYRARLKGNPSLGERGAPGAHLSVH